jgi:hypothetical protein
MARYSYKTALRAKGFKPVPSADRLRSSINPVDEKDVYICATTSALRERATA